MGVVGRGDVDVRSRPPSHTSVHVSVHMPIHISAHIPIPSIHLCTCLDKYLYTCPQACPNAHVYTHVRTNTQAVERRDALKGVVMAAFGNTRTTLNHQVLQHAHACGDGRRARFMRQRTEGPVYAATDFFFRFGAESEGHDETFWFLMPVAVRYDLWPSLLVTQ